MIDDDELAALRDEAADEVLEELTAARSQGDDYCVDELPTNLASRVEVADD